MQAASILAFSNSDNMTVERSSNRDCFGVTGSILFKDMLLMLQPLVSSQLKAHRHSSAGGSLVCSTVLGFTAL